MNRNGIHCPCYVIRIKCVFTKTYIPDVQFQKMQFKITDILRTKKVSNLVLSFNITFERCNLIGFYFICFAAAYRTQTTPGRDKKTSMMNKYLISNKI